MFKSISRSVVPFVLHMIVFFIFAAIIGHSFKPIAILSLVALPIYLINAISLQYIFGYLSARFRDVEHLVTALLRILFFMTPILWLYEDLTDFRRVVADLNPLTHFVEIFRAPLLGEAPSLMNWQMVGASTLAFAVIPFAISAVLRRRLPLLV